MGFPIYPGLISTPLRVKHKVFISYHHGSDQRYYDAFSSTFHDTYEAIYDNSLERRIDSDNVDYVRQRIRSDFITGSSCTIVLVGKDTWGRKYVDWEIDATLDLHHGLLGVQLPTASSSAQNTVIVPSRLYDNINSGFALWLSWQQITASAAGLNAYVADAKARSTSLIVNSRERRLRNE
jgi:hypothetical protein